MHLVQVWQLELLWRSNSCHSIAAGVSAGVLQLVPTQCMAHRVVPRRLRQCNQQLCLHICHLRPAGSFSSKRRLYWRACLPCAHCKHSLMEICAAPTSAADVHLQCCPEHSERRAYAWLSVRLPCTAPGPCQNAGSFWCQQAALLEHADAAGASHSASVAALAARPGLQHAGAPHCQSAPPEC